MRGDGLLQEDSATPSEGPVGSAFEPAILGFEIECTIYHHRQPANECISDAVTSVNIVCLRSSESCTMILSCPYCQVVQ
jgi:hypothetical protein